MKKLLLILLAIPFLGIAQEADWHPLPSDQVSYFAIIPTNAVSQHKYRAIKCIRIDSIINSNGDEIYYNVRTPEWVDFDDDGFTYYDPYTSWIGKSTIISEGKAYFQNRDNELLAIDFSRNDTVPWLFYTSAEGEYIEAHIDSVKEIEILPGLVDSVKRIAFQSFDIDGNSVESSINDDILVLSKNYGFVNTFSFEKSYPHFSERKLIGLEIDNNQYGFEFNFDDYVSNYQVGDIIHIEDVDKSLSNKQTYTSKIIEDDYIQYDLHFCFENGNTSSSPRTYWLNRLPGESMFMEENPIQQGFIKFSMRLTDWEGEHEYSMQVYSNVYEKEYNGQYVWAYDEGTGMSNFSPVETKCNRTHTFSYSANYESSANQIKYYHNTTSEWGEPHAFSCESAIYELSNSRISIAPNPSNGNFSFTNNSSQNIKEIIIYNTKGKIVWQQEAQENEQNIDVSFLATGLYLMKVHLEGDEVINRKLMIE